MCRRLLGTTATIILALSNARAAGAQARVALEPANRDTVTIDGTTTATVVFRVRNLGADSVVVRPALALPNGWTSLFALPAIPLPPSGSDTWLAGFVIPPSVAAGTYVVRASVPDATNSVSDSILVRVAERRALQVARSAAPAFVGTHDHYQATFFISNRGNVAAHLALNVHSSAGSTCVLSEQRIDLDPGGRKTVIVNAVAPAVPRSTDDVIELSASDVSNGMSESAAARVLIVPRSTSGTNDTPSLPAELSLRAAGSDAGVSPLVVRGGGAIRPGSATNIDFSVHAPVHRQSIFAERDELRVDITNPSFRLGIGDEWRAFSPLTTSGFPGFGAGFETRDRTVNSGIYLQQGRWSANRGLELGALASANVSDNIFASTAIVARSSGARAASFTTRSRILASSALELELAGSDSASANGLAQRVQFNGSYDIANVDVGAVHATNAFVGPSRGIDQAHVSIATQPTGPLSFQLNSAVLHYSPRFDSPFALDQRFSASELIANFSNDFSFAYQLTTRHLSGAGDLMAVSQHGPRMSGHYRIASIDVRGTMAYQRATFGHDSERPYIFSRIETNAELRGNQWVGLYGESSSGSAFDGLTDGGYTAATWAYVRLPFGVMFDFNGSLYLPSTGGARNRSGDLTLTRRLPNGTTFAFRQHFTVFDRGRSLPGMNALYFELRTPLRIPTSRPASSGRVVGQVTDAATGRGLSNLLVRIGDRSVISDSRGRVAVSGLEPGRYGVSLENTHGAAGGFLVGDVAVDVLADRHAPTRFSVALAPSGRVHADVRLMVPGTGAVGGNPDSLVEAGGLENVLMALEGARDTIYESTDSDGQLDFGQVAAGTWTVRIVSVELPSHHALDVDHLQIVVRSGEPTTVTFHVVPKQRALRMVTPADPQEVIRAKPLKNARAEPPK